MTTVHISIIVSKGTPLDHTHSRPTALWPQFADNSPPLLVQIVGPPGESAFENKENSQPWETQQYAKTIDVGDLTAQTTPDQTVRALRRIPIRNDDREFNCQQWV
jgi:hypothetical protein